MLYASFNSADKMFVLILSDFNVFENVIAGVHSISYHPNIVVM